MPRSPSLVLAAVLVATLASPNVRGELNPPPPPGGAYPPGPPPPAHGSRRKGLMIGGLATLTGTYLLTVLLVLNSTGSTNGMVSGCLDCKARPRLLVPIAGPWLAMPYAVGNDKTLFTVLGLAQATGAVLSTVGIWQFAASGPTADEGAPAQGPRQSRSNRQVSFGLLPVRDGAFGFASAQF
jgi:hypothetical protein